MIIFLRKVRHGLFNEGRLSMYLQCDHEYGLIINRLKLERTCQYNCPLLSEKYLNPNSNALIDAI